MKKCYIIGLLLLMFVGCQYVMADVVTTTRRIRPQTGQTPNPQTQTQKNIPTCKQRVHKAVPEMKLANSVKSCKKYSEVMNSTVSGVDFNFKISILGWIDNKCRIDFVAQSTGINQIFSSLYGVDASMAQISTFEPKVKCAFSRQQLERVGDSILQEEERANGGGRMLKDPTSITIPSISNMSGSDLALMDVILNDRACTILNAPNSDDMFNSLFGY